MAVLEYERRITRLESQLRDMEAMRDEAAWRYIAQVQECTDKQREVNRLRECLRTALDFINDWKSENKPDADFEEWFANLAAAIKEGE